MRRNTLILKSTLLFFVYFSAFSQGEFLKKGESGFDAQAGFTNTNTKSFSGNTVDASIGYSFKTMFDVTVGFSRTHPSSTVSFTPSISYYLSNQTNDKDETSAMSLLYHHDSDQNTIGAAFSLAHDFFFEKSFFLQANFHIILYPSYKTNSGTRTLIIPSAGLNVGIRTAGGHTAAITPIAGYQEGNVFLGGSVTFIMNTDPSDH